MLLPMALLIIKTGDTLQALTDAGRGDFEHWFRSGMGLARDQVHVVDVARGSPLPEPSSVSGALVTGSPAMVSERPGWSESTASWLRRAAAETTIPLFGVCFGHQLLAHALGGTVGPNPRGPHLGTARVRLAPGASEDPLLQDLQSLVAVQVSHFEVVLTLPPGARRLAHCPADGNHGFALGERIWGLQFHPEFDAITTRAYIEAKRTQLLADGQDPDRLLAAVHDTPVGTRILRRFRRLAAS